MLTLKIYGDKQGAKFIWSIEAVDSSGKSIVTDGIDDSERDAKGRMTARLGALVQGLEFGPIREDGIRDLDRMGS
jgi:hypothetical protein